MNENERHWSGWLDVQKPLAAQPPHPASVTPDYQPFIPLHTWNSVNKKKVKLTVNSLCHGESSGLRSKRSAWRAAKIRKLSEFPHLSTRNACFAGYGDRKDPIWAGPKTIVQRSICIRYRATFNVWPKLKSKPFPRLFSSLFLSSFFFWWEARLVYCTRRALTTQTRLPKLIAVYPLDVIKFSLLPLFILQLTRPHRAIRTLQSRLISKGAVVERISPDIVQLMPHWCVYRHNSMILNCKISFIPMQGRDSVSALPSSLWTFDAQMQSTHWGTLRVMKCNNKR